MKITLHSQYDNFTIGKTPKYIQWIREPSKLHCYVNEYVTQEPEENSIALILEPRSIIPGVYNYMEEHWKDYKYVFTHDSKLMRIADNSHLILFGGVWASDPREKTKNISMIASDKSMCTLHKVRADLARKLKDKIDCYGSSVVNYRISTEDAHGPYKFAVVIENYLDQDYFTEKICNCFANKTIPIYYGALNICDYFNPDGIMLVRPGDMENFIDLLDCQTEYDNRLEAVEDNYNRVKKYECFEDWFYNAYFDLLEELL